MLTTMKAQVRCPKCGGRLYLEQELSGRFHLPREWACLQCGWRRAYTPPQFERTFALATDGAPPA